MDWEHEGDEIQEYIEGAAAAIIKLLIEAGADIDAYADELICEQDTDEPGWSATALILAVHYSIEPLVRVLIESGADLDLVTLPCSDGGGASALIHAVKGVRKGPFNMSIVKMLVTNGADLDICDSNDGGNFPDSGHALYHAIYNSHYDCAHYLVEAGSNLEYKNWGENIVTILNHKEEEAVSLIRHILLFYKFNTDVYSVQTNIPYDEDNYEMRFPKVQGGRPSLRTFFRTTEELYYFMGKRAISHIFDAINQWPVVMTIACLKKHAIFHLLDMSMIDLFAFIGQEKDYFEEDEINFDD